MVLATINRPQELLYLNLFGDVLANELVLYRAEIAALLTDLKPGFRLITDLARLNSIEIEAAPEIGRVMDMCDQKGVGMVIRVIPDPSKDIGLNILTFFHYHHGPKTITCATLEEAVKTLDPATPP